MSDVLSEEELVKELGEAFACYRAWMRQSGKKNINGTMLKSEQAHQQIVARLEHSNTVDKEE